MKNKFLICVICVICGGIFPSCSPQKRLERLIKRYPELIYQDTVDFTAFVPVPAKASQFQINMNLKDSMVQLHGDSQIILTYFVTNDSIIEVLVEVPADTIPVPVRVPVEKVKYIRPDTWSQLIKTIPYLCLAFIALVISAIFLYKKK